MSPPRSNVDLAIVGAGPAGLAVAMLASRSGLRTVVCERSAGPPDKACGEGLMPAGLRVLGALGARDLLGPEDCSPIEGIRYIEEDGTTLTGRLPAGGGLGIRRTALAAALAKTAAGDAVEIRWGTTATGFAMEKGFVEVQTSAGKLRAGLLVVADGLHSPLRRIAGLDAPALDAPPKNGTTVSRERFGLRQHFQVPPWSRFVEVHLGVGVEAFVTPAGASRVGIAFLWEKGGVTGPTSLEALLRHFPALAEKLSGAKSDSEPRGAGPFAHSVRSRIGCPNAVPEHVHGAIRAPFLHRKRGLVQKARALSHYSGEPSWKKADYSNLNRRPARMPVYGAGLREETAGVTRVFELHSIPQS